MLPDVVQAAASVVVAALQPGVDAGWSVRAGDLEWSVDHTIAHMTGAPAKYALYLSSRSTRYVAVRIVPSADATRQERLDAIEGCSAALAGGAATVPRDAFGFHVSGMRNAEQFLAMACEELLVHAYDVTRGLGLPYEPPEELRRLVIEHCYPATTGWGKPPGLDDRSEIPLEFGRDPATGVWHAIRWTT
jgi:hypothetical protein